MKKVFIWFLCGVGGLVVVAVVGILLCRTVFKNSLLKYYNEALFDERVELLRSAEYRQSDVDFGFVFCADSVNAAKTWNYFRLDTVTADDNDTWSKSIAIAKIVCANIPHENQTVEPEDKTAAGLWAYHENTGSGINCMYHSVMLHEMLNAAGITNRIIWCMPMDSTDRDCHVVNHVWLPEYRKWAMLDSDMNTFLTGADGIPMSIAEIRADLIGRNQSIENPILSCGARVNFYKAYLSKNLYWFETIQNSGFDLYAKPMRYIRLVPAGYERFKASGSNHIATTDDKKFWSAPRSLSMSD